MGQKMTSKNRQGETTKFSSSVPRTKKKRLKVGGGGGGAISARKKIRIPGNSRQLLVSRILLSSKESGRCEWEEEAGIRSCTDAKESWVLFFCPKKTW